MNRLRGVPGIPKPSLDGPYGGLPFFDPPTLSIILLSENVSCASASMFVLLVQARCKSLYIRPILRRLGRAKGWYESALCSSFPISRA
jgi:hypothetical protein